MALAPGTRLGHYLIGEPLGQGGMGEVYRATDTRLGREVAIKVLPAALAGHPDRLARFEREAKTLATLNHPNIAGIYGLEDQAIAMELVEGATLAERIRSGLAREDAVKIAIAIADALEAAHEKGIVHRDLKPANVKAPVDGPVKVLDFGLATAVQADRDTSNAANSPTLTMGATEAGVILGTAAYMRPEQASGKRVDRRADIWSFGVVLWEMLTGKRLFGDGETVSHVLADVLKAPIDFGVLPAGALRELVERCLDRNTRTRLRDIGEARVVLERFLTNPAPPAARPSRAVGGKLAWTVAAALAVALGYLAWTHAREPLPSAVTLSFPLPEKYDLVLSSAPALAVSPDGKHVALRLAQGGQNSLWVRNMDSGSLRQLPGTAGASGPFWAPDSKRLGFIAGGKLKKVDITGGPALTICDAPPVLGASWGEGDVIVLGDRGPLLQVSAAGGTPRPITQLDKSAGELAHSAPWFLPGSKSLLYQAQAGDAEGKVYAMTLGSKERKLVLQDLSNAAYAAGQLLFVRERTLMSQPFDAKALATTGEAVPVAEQLDPLSGGGGVFSVSQTGVLAYRSGGSGGKVRLTWFDHAGKRLSSIGPLVEQVGFSLSPDGKSVVTSRQDATANSRQDLWLIDLVRGTESRLTFEGRNRFPLVWSADGASVYYSSGLLGKTKIYRKAANGTGQPELVGDAEMAPLGVSPDGRYLITATFSGNPKTGTDVWVLPLSGDKKPFPYVATEFAETWPRLSPDGRWLAYQSNESRRVEVYVVSFPDPGGKWQISSTGGDRPEWSRDGRELYFYSEGKIMAAQIAPGDKFAASIPKALFEARISTNNIGFAVAADGRFLLPMIEEQTTQAPVTVVLNWPQLGK